MSDAQGLRGLQGVVATRLGDALSCGGSHRAEVHLVGSDHRGHGAIGVAQAEMASRVLVHGKSRNYRKRMSLSWNELYAS